MTAPRTCEACGRQFTRGHHLCPWCAPRSSEPLDPESPALPAELWRPEDDVPGPLTGTDAADLDLVRRVREAEDRELAGLPWAPWTPQAEARRHPGRG